MNLWVLALSHFLHILGTVVWIGGIIMTLRVILPSAKTALESTPAAGKLMAEVTRRFTPLANISIFILIGTGLIIIYHDKNSAAILDLNDPQKVVILLKLLLAAAMVSIHFYRGLILNPAIVKSSLQANDPQMARLKKFSLDLVKTNLVLGIMILLLAAVSIS